MDAFEMGFTHEDLRLIKRELLFRLDKLLEHIGIDQCNLWGDSSDNDTLMRYISQIDNAQLLCQLSKDIEDKDISLPSRDRDVYIFMLTLVKKQKLVQKFPTDSKQENLKAIRAVRWYWESIISYLTELIEEQRWMFIKDSKCWKPLEGERKK